MSVPTITKSSHEFNREQRGMYGIVWREERKGEKVYNYVIISKNRRNDQ